MTNLPRKGIRRIDGMSGGHLLASPLPSIALINDRRECFYASTRALKPGLPGVRLEFLPPCSLGYDPIEESFAESKAWMKT